MHNNHKRVGACLINKRTTFYYTEFHFKIHLNCNYKSLLTARLYNISTSAFIFPNALCVNIKNSTSIFLKPYFNLYFNKKYNTSVHYNPQHTSVCLINKYTTCYYTEFHCKIPLKLQLQTMINGANL